MKYVFHGSTSHRPEGVMNFLFNSDIDYAVGWDMYQDVQPFIKNFDAAPGVEVFCVYGYGIPTVEK